MIALGELFAIRKNLDRGLVVFFVFSLSLKSLPSTRLPKASLGKPSD